MFNSQSKTSVVIVTVIVLGVLVVAKIVVAECGGGGVCRHALVCEWKVELEKGEL